MLLPQVGAQLAGCPDGSRDAGGVGIPDRADTDVLVPFECFVLWFRSRVDG